jgi:hypothetical protein
VVDCIIVHQPLSPWVWHSLPTDHQRTPACNFHSHFHSQDAILAVMDAATAAAADGSPAAPQAASAAVAAMRAAEASLARQKAAAGYTAVLLDGSLHQCHCLLAAAQEGLAAAKAAAQSTGGSSSSSDGWWRIVAAAAGWLADIFSRAQHCISSRGLRGPALKQAEDVFHRALNAPPLGPQLCCCLADAAPAAVGSAAAGAADAVVAALAAMVHAAASSATRGSSGGHACVADHFPLAQSLSAKLSAAPDQGVDGDASLLEVGERCGVLVTRRFVCTRAKALLSEPDPSARPCLWYGCSRRCCQAVRAAVGASLASSKPCLAALRERCSQQQPAALLVVLHCCRCCPQLCEAAVSAGLPEVLLRSATASGNPTATLSLLVLAAAVSGVAGPAEALASGSLQAPPSSAHPAGAAGSDGGSSGHQQHVQQEQQWQEQWLRLRQQQLTAALQVVRPCQATDAVIVKLSGEMGREGCAGVAGGHPAPLDGDACRPTTTARRSSWELFLMSCVSARFFPLQRCCTTTRQTCGYPLQQQQQSLPICQSTC